ncbi:uncharacterized protein [Cherax quadricarinatus]|uniref:uncharacterized protein n=1 Tax=Cherax quadricarinatus TaxID=27406 RepID=UPI00237949BF|nr:uncharacterized protein LOC128685402 [Cherax quadricarinatus]
MTHAIMKLLVLVCLLAVAADASHLGYSLPAPAPAPPGPGYGGSICGPEQIRNVDGSCVTPQVTRNLYVFNAPPAPPIIGPRPYVPPPRVEHNILFIRSPDIVPGPEPIVVPPPQQKNVLYVLSKRPQYDQKVIHVPAPEQGSPQVYYVNYSPGDNPTLPTGGDLNSALRSATDGGGEVVSNTGGSYGGGAPPIPQPSPLYSLP